MYPILGPLVVDLHDKLWRYFQIGLWNCLLFVFVSKSIIPQHACVLLWLCIGEQYGNPFSHGVPYAIILSRKKKDRFKALTSHLSLPPTRQLNDTISALHLQGFDWRKRHFRCEFRDGTGQVLQCIGSNGHQPREMRIMRKNRWFLHKTICE